MIIINLKKDFLRRVNLLTFEILISLDNNVKEMTMAFCEQYTNSKSYKK